MDFITRPVWSGLTLSIHVVARYLLEFIYHSLSYCDMGGKYDYYVLGFRAINMAGF